MPDNTSPAGFNNEDLNKVFIFITKEALSELPVPFAKLISEILTQILQHSLALPEDHEKIVNGKLDAIINKIDALGRQLDDWNHLSTVVDRMQNVAKPVNSKIKLWWQMLQNAKTNGDAARFKKVLLEIGRQSVDGMEMTMGQLHEDLAIADAPHLVTAGNRPVNGPSLELFRILLENRVTSTDQYFAYDVFDLRRDFERWALYLSDIQAKGTALSIMYENFCFFEAKNKCVSNSDLNNLKERSIKKIKTLNETYEKRCQKYKEILNGGVLQYPSAQLLLEQGSIDLTHERPMLYSLNLWDSDKYLKIDCDSAELLDSYSLGSGGPNFSQAFAFTRTPNNTWMIRGSRFDAHPEGPGSWNICRNDKEDKWGLFETNPVELKVIPRPSSAGVDPRVTLLLLDKDRTSVKKRWNVWVQERRNLLTFTTAPDPGQRILDVLGKNKRVLFWINNLTTGNLVFVLQDVRATCGRAWTCFATNGSIWLNQQRGCVGFGCSLLALAEVDAEVVIKLRIYQVRATINAKERSAVEPLVFQDPLTGRLSLRDDNARAHADMYIKIWNPSGIRRNYVSAITFLPGTLELGRRWSDLHPKPLENALEQVKAAQNDTRENPGFGVRMRYHITGTDTPNGSVSVESWGDMAEF